MVNSNIGAIRIGVSPGLPKIANTESSHVSGLRAPAVRNGDGCSDHLRLKKNPVLMVFPTPTLHLH